MKLDRANSIGEDLVLGDLANATKSDVKELSSLDAGQSIMLFACVSTSWSGKE